MLDHSKMHRIPGQLRAVKHMALNKCFLGGFMYACLGGAVSGPVWKLDRLQRASCPVECRNLGRMGGDPLGEVSAGGPTEGLHLGDLHLGCPQA